MGKFYTSKEFAKAIGYSRQHISLMIKRGFIKTEIVGRLHAISEKELQKWKAKAATGRYHTFPRSPKHRGKARPKN